VKGMTASEPQVVASELTTNSSPGPEGAGSVLVEHEDDRTALTSFFFSEKNQALAALPLQLDVSIPIPEFRVADLLSLTKGTVLESNWSHAEDIPVWCGGARLMWTEFEVIDDVLAVRVTRVG
jgi:flagellar motor switch/type III secretory pathway protein FliN